MKKLLVLHSGTGDRKRAGRQVLQHKSCHANPLPLCLSCPRFNWTHEPPERADPKKLIHLPIKVKKKNTRNYLMSNNRGSVM